VSAAWPAPVARAYDACQRFARSHYENFPVASWLLPRAMRPHVAAVYAYARVADDWADEGTVPPDERRRRLAGWGERLHRAVDSPSTGEASSRDDQIVLALGHSIRTLDLPVSLFDDLLSAFAQDTSTTRYESWGAVLDYCRRSANPVGRLVLRIAGYRSDRLDASSDALCTALQLTNFWQDFGRDWRVGRLYVPRELQDAAGASEDDLAHGRMTSAWVETLGACGRFTRARFDEGRTVCDDVAGRLRVELRLTWLGGTRILERAEALGAGLFDHRPTLGVVDAAIIAKRAFGWTNTRA
jgi:squalene synthase HpnC